MSSIAETVLFVFSLVGLGYLAGLAGYLKAETGEGVADFAVNVAMPLVLFRAMAAADFHDGFPWGFWGVYFAAVIVTWTTGHIIVTRLFGCDPQVGVVGGVSAAFSNLVLLGIPFVLGVYGQPGFETLSLLVSIHLPTMIMASIILFEVFGKRSDPAGASALLRMFFARISRNPLIIGILAGLLWRATGEAMPALPSRIISALADIAGTIALFAMGLSLSRFGLSGNIRLALALSASKLVLMPAVAMVLAWVVGLPPLTAQVVVAAAALPSGVNSYLIATQFGTGQALASKQMTLATLLSVVTLSFWVWAAHLAFT